MSFTRTPSVVNDVLATTGGALHTISASEIFTYLLIYLDGLIYENHVEKD